MIMKYLYRAIASLLLFCSALFYASGQLASGYSELYDSETVAKLKEHVRMFTSYDFQGRKAGSEGEKASASYAFSVMKSYGLEMLTPEEGEIFGIHREGADTLTSRNVYGYIRGYDKKLSKRYIVVAARLDNLGADSVTIDSQRVPRIYHGANGNASGLSMLLELSGKVSAASFLFRRSVIFIGLGASQESYAGAWYFLNRSFSEAGHIDAVINLDMLGAGASSFQAYTGSNEDMNKILSLTKEELQPVLPEVTAVEAYPSDHRAFYSYGIPFVYFSTGRYPEHNSDRDTEDILDYPSMEQELEYLFNFTRMLASVEVAPTLRPSASGNPDDDVYAWYDCSVKPTFLGLHDPGMWAPGLIFPYIVAHLAIVRTCCQRKVAKAVQVLLVGLSIRL